MPEANATEANAKLKMAVVISMAVLLATGATIIVIKTSPNSRSGRLLDGSPVVLEGVSFGTGHVSPTAQPPALLRLLPANWLHLLKWNSGTIKTVTQKTNTMVFWLQYDNSDRDKPVRYAIADENGFESTVSFNGPYFEYDRGGFGKKKIGHARSFGLLPRRASRFYLRLYQQNSQGRLERVANFPIQNVPAKDVPNWSASPLPAAQKTNGLVFTLEKAVVGILPTEKLVPPYDSFPGQWSEFRFRVSDHGNPSSGWSVNEILISDATGNQVRTSKEDVQSLNGTFSRIELDVIVCTHRWGFWPGESAWKLRVRFEHQARLDFWAEFLIKPDFLQ